MTDWQRIDIPAFDKLIGENEPLECVSAGVLDRLPFSFATKRQYLRWRDALGRDLGVDGKDVTLVGSAASGRSLNARKQFKTFHSKSDLDIAVVSSHHFDISWRWFRNTNPNLITGLDAAGLELFEKHKKHYIFEGIVAADYFLSYLPFGGPWMESLQRSEDNLPINLRGRLMKVRIYREYAALRAAQTEAVKSYKGFLDNKLENKAAAAAAAAEAEAAATESSGAESADTTTTESPTRLENGSPASPDPTTPSETEGKQ